MIKQFVNLIVVAAVLAVGVYFFAPGLWTKVEHLYHEKAGWNEEAKKERPVDYLRYVLNNAEQEFANIDQYLVDYNASIIDLRGRVKESKTVVVYDTDLLDEMKALYQSVEQGSAQWPVEFRGAAYTEDQFEKQVEVLLNERRLHEEIVEKVTQEIEGLHDGLTDLRAAKAEYKAKLAQIRADLAIAQATQGTSSIDAVIRNADRVMSYVDQTSAEFMSPVRSGAQITQNSTTEKDVSTSEVQAFLSR